MAGLEASLPESDDFALEVAEWGEALQALLQHGGAPRVRALLDALSQIARQPNIGWQPGLITPYVNTIPVSEQPRFPGDLAIEERLVAIMRWNALAMVIRANRAHGDLGGHIASYASAADLFEVGFNHFFRAKTEQGGGDLIFYQPHSAPGIYARAYAEGRLQAEDLASYRQELTAQNSGRQGLSSYPHPWLMPSFWQFPTGSMGLGPISSIYQARFMRYLSNRGLLDTEDRRVWGVFGDGEMDEPESMSALTLAAREGLDNLTWVINCNLQRLDGPVRGNGRIIDELEALFSGAGWNVVKLLWGSDWDGLFAQDSQGVLLRTFANTVDGQLQTFAAKDGRFNRENFFGQHSALSALVEGLSDSQIDRLKRGGHDLVKIHAAYASAISHKGRPTVILAQTKKGYGMGEAGQGKMTTHQQKKLDLADLLDFRDRFALPLSDEQVEHLTFYRPTDDSPEMQYLKQQRRRLGGYLPVRSTTADRPKIPELSSYAGFALTGSNKPMSTTMGFVRMLTALLKDGDLGSRIVPIVADEARTFGMANLFKQVGIYSSTGQCYEPEDIGSLLSYREALDGQILEEGISEAGAISSWTAAATSYSVHGLTMIPFYIYYSMFGFQRVGDLIWAAADQRARGFLLGATAGRTTLGGEGLQHQDGHSHVFAATVPNCRAYDPASISELAVILAEGMRRMFDEQCDEFYYITMGNEAQPQAAIPKGAERDVCRGLYLVETRAATRELAKVRLLGSGSIMVEVTRAANYLADNHQIACEIWSATSYPELARDQREAVRWNRLHPSEPRRLSHVRKCLSGNSPVIATTDYVTALPLMISEALEAPFSVLGTDGFGRSDTRAALRSFFEIDWRHIVLAALTALADQGEIDRQVCVNTIDVLEIDAESEAPWSR